MLKIRRPLGRLIFNMGIAIPGKTVFLIETAPWSKGITPLFYFRFSASKLEPRPWFNITGIILYMHPANERQCYIVMLSLIGWAHTQSDPCIKMSSYQYRKSHCADKTILWPSSLHNGISNTGKMTSLYWIMPLVIGAGYWGFLEPLTLIMKIDVCGEETKDTSLIIHHLCSPSVNPNTLCATSKYGIKWLQCFLSHSIP